MKEKAPDRFAAYAESLPADKQQQLAAFFDALAAQCRLPKKEAVAMRADFEDALLYYHEQGVPFDEALCRIDTAKLGGFYAHPPVLWFALDNAAKVYPLYMKHGSMAGFRLSVYLKKPVVPVLLQLALAFTVKRFPSFATTLKKGFFWHYLDTAKHRFCAAPENDYPCQPLKVAGSGSLTFRVVYYQNRISIEFFHVLTDGVGGMTFLKVLTAEYLRLLGVDAPDEGCLWNVNTPPSVREVENAFATVPSGENGGGFMEKAAVQLNGRVADRTPCRLLHFRLSATEIKAAAKRYDATVTEYLLGLMFLANKTATDELTGDTSIQVPVDMRRLFPTPTVRNFSMYCGIRVPLESITTLPAAVEEAKRQMAQKASKEVLQEMVTSTKKLVGSLKFIPLAIKTPVAKIVCGLLGDKTCSNVLSNLGVVKMPAAFAEHIDSMDFSLGAVEHNRAECAVVTFGDILTFSVTKMTVDPTFEETMYRLFVDEGLTVRVEGSPLYES